jgi:arsenate reductase-like glutaredoxin family protein
MAIFSRVFLPFLLLAYIATETYMKLQNTSLCGEVGCKLAGELLRFNPLYLNYLGMGAVFTLLVLGYFSLKSKILERLFFIVLYSAIAFETTIIGYQFIANPEPCVFCLGIYSSLLLIAALSHFKRFAAVLAVTLSIFFGLNTLAISKNKAYTVNDGLYLIQSASCGHCKKVKKYFKENDINYTPISVNEVSARSFLKFVNISSIPVAVIKNSTGIRLINGDKDIIAHFDKQQLPQEKSIEMPQALPTTQSSALGLPSDIFSATSEPGCAITITETPACEDENTSH